jgi:hypothetical protein
LNFNYLPVYFDGLSPELDSDGQLMLVSEFVVGELEEQTGLSDS